ncbi:MAG: tRNA (adenosine(37)-N6)-dimethylallyltransferase MiaA [Eubacteriales bacterium]|nr:tRNA (adenosine(37)-N6)-dimethylallyltransferase MiaA [Eubacteriales bacterium]
MQDKKTVLFVAGPTAVGKTKYAIEIARAFQGEIISADSMQIYRYMDIGSAKPSKEELTQAKHHLVDEIDPREEFSVAEYQILAKKYIDQIFQEGKIPVVAGGTGLYLNSLLYEMDFSIMPKQADFRKQLEQDAEQHGSRHVHDRLKSLDPAAAERIHPNNLKKVIRAIEVAETTGERMREFRESFIPTKEYACVLIGLTRDREELYRRIDQRVDQLVKAGLVQEIESLLKMGLTENSISMKGIGYKEIIAHLHGEYDLNEAVRLVKRNTRHYAKRQLTWLRRYADMSWFNLSEYPTEENALSAIIDRIRSKR